MHQGTEHRTEGQSVNFTAQRWKLKADAFFIRVKDGVELQNNKGSYQIRGESAYALIDWIFRGFQNPTSLDELCAGMAEAKKAVIARQVETLKNRGFLREVLLPPETLPPWAETFSDVIAFIHQFEDAPFSRFQAFREKRFLCSGRTSVAFLETLSAYGARNIDVLVPQDAPGVMEQIAALQERMQPAEINIQVSTLPGSSLEDSAVLRERDFDCALIAGPLDAEPGLSHLCASVLQEGKHLSIVAYSGNAVAASPLFGPGENFCWECMHRTLYLESSAQRRQGAAAPAAMALSCNHVIHNLFCYYTGIDQSLLSHCAVVNCDTLATSIHPITRHPACTRHDGIEVRSASFYLEDRDFIRPNLPASDDPEHLVKIQDQIISWSDQLTDKVVGPFLALEEGNLPQLPFSTSRCVIRTLESVAGNAGSREIVARGISTREARNQVALFGIEYLADEVIDARTAVACRLLEQLDALSDESSRPAVTVGAGWSAGEAIYRSLHRNALSWATGSAPDEAFHAAPLRFIRDSAHMQYFARLYPELLEPGLSVRIGRAPSGMVVARLSTSSENIAWGAGLDEDHACENAVAELSNRHCAGGKDIAFLRTVYLLPQSGTWLEALHINAIEVPRHIDAAALLPACHSKAFLALMKA